MNPIETLVQALRQRCLLLIWGELPFSPESHQGRRRQELIRRWRHDSFTLKPIAWPLAVLSPLPILSLDPSSRLTLLFEHANIPFEIVPSSRLEQMQDLPFGSKHIIFPLGGDLPTEQGLLVTWDDVRALTRRPNSKQLLAAASRICRDGVVLVCAPGGALHFGRIWQSALAAPFRSATVFGLGRGPWPPDITPLERSPIEVLSALQHAQPPRKPALAMGPDIVWRGPTDERELQLFEQRIPEIFDIGYLKRILARTKSICRIEIPKDNPIGTGFLVAKGLILTNYHVLQRHDTDTMQQIAPKVLLRFNYITPDEGEKEDDKHFQLARHRPILAASPTDRLDYVLLQAEERIYQDRDLHPVPYNITEIPQQGMGLSILQHPQGEPMKFAPGINSVVDINRETGLIQYWTKTSGGSSGSPCFNESGKVVALHHAERSRYFGTIREGILFHTIYQEIKDIIISRENV